MPKKTISSIFLLPTLKIPRDKLNSYGIVNAYIADADRENYKDDYLYVLFNPPNKDMFNEFVDSEYENEDRQIVEDYDYPDNFSVLVYKLNPKWKKDYELIREGKYSKTCKEFQGMFQKVIKVVIDGLHRDEISLQYRVFKRSTDLIDYWEEKTGVKFDEGQEVWRGFFVEKETLNIENIKKRLKEVGNGYQNTA